MVMTRLPTFRGGVHIPDHKELTATGSIRVLPLPERVFLPLWQNTGISPVPVVKVGERVKAGQVIARPGGEISTTLHASVSGRVKSISLYPHPAGPPSPAIEIETDLSDEGVELMEPLSGEITPERIRERVLQAGVVGMGGAAFPTQVKLNPPPGSRIEYAIINAAECEPYLTVDQRLLLERTRKVISGLRLIMKAAGAREGVIAVEANKTDAFNKLTGLLGKSPDLRAELLKVKYPQGGEKQLIYSLFQRRVPAGGLPAAVGCVAQNVHTAVAIAEAVEEGKPLIERVVTVTGPGLKKPGNFQVRLGTPFFFLIEAAGGVPAGPVQVISGGPMMGIAQGTLKAPVIKGTSGILILPEIERRRNQPCIRCGECARVCPMGLLPSELARAVEKGRIDLFQSGGGANCIECGACVYVCQAGRDLVQLIQLGKQALKKIKRT